MTIAMAESVKLSPRITYIRDRREEAFRRDVIPTRDKAYREAFEQNPNDCKMLQFAKGLARFMSVKKIQILPYDILAGFAFRYAYNTTLPITMSENFDPRFRPAHPISREREMEESIAWHRFAPESDEAKEMRLFSDGMKCWLFKHWESGHILPGYHNFLHRGVDAFILNAEQELKDAEPERKPFVESMLICLQATTEYIERYAIEAERMIPESTETEYADNLRRIADACHYIAHNAPRTFFEAVQLFWFLHEIMLIENFPSSVSLGRLDKTLYPFYKKDAEEGRLSYEEASDYIDALWIKFGANLHAYQNVTIGGYDDDGGFLANDVTYMILQASRRLMFDQPLISLRYNDKMPQKMWDESFALIKTGTGFPAFFGDDRMISGRIHMNIEPDDAKDYALIGCVEPGIPGKEYAKTEVLRINTAMVLELLLHDGNTLLDGVNFPLADRKDLDVIGSFKEFYEWYKSELRHIAGIATRTVNRLDESLMWLYPTPYLSATMEGTLASGKDVTGGGTIYNNTGINLCGFGNTIDSLSAIKKLVFDEKAYTLRDVADAIAANFEGYGELRHRAKHNKPCFGNDEDEADDMASDIVADFFAFIDELKNPRNGKYQLGLYSVEDHAKMGVHTAATPDGRLAGVALSNGFGPAQGKDVVGPTAVVNSILKVDLNAVTNGMVLDLKFNPQFLENPKHTDALRTLIETYFRDGGAEIQFNVVSKETLLAAQARPEEYKDLVVRVSGFSAYFTTLMKPTQDEIIARTEYACL